jgi:membrane-associated phospholipid phosphatase/tRNA A-37 threonylcarbamoyl transferase component Bud32
MSDDREATARRGLRRRPSGQPPPLPRSWDRPARLWLAASAIVATAGTVIAASVRLRTTVVVLDGEAVRWLADLRPGDGSLIADVHDLVTDWFVPVVGWATVGVLVIARRVRHLVVWFGAFVVAGVVATVLSAISARPRPVEVEILGRWDGPSFPSPTMTAAALLVVAAAYSLVPAGTIRRRFQVGGGVVLAVLAALELWAGVGHPTDVAAGVLLGGATAILAFRWFAPDEVFPVTSRSGNAAHLDVSGRRGEAIRSAVEEQLGLVVSGVKPVGSAGSAGSTPLRIEVADAETGERRPDLFAKLLARSHLRSDRWYKFGRTLLYGRLEDEQRFATVRRLVEREDYLILRVEAAGIVVPHSHGVVEITPEREYLLVTDFLDGFVELGEAADHEVAGAVVDEGLEIVRKMWDSGLAHRDIKPANIMIGSAGQTDDASASLALIDVAFGQVRPSPWRQAVDLANMMLVLALRTSPDIVYERALEHFTPDDVAEAFAVTGSVTVPSELRRRITADGRDLMGRFRALAPPARRVPVQRWSVRRVLMWLWVVVASLVGAVLAFDLLQAAGMLP